MALALDAIDTTTLSVSTTGTNDVDTGAITNTDQVTSITMTTAADGGNVVTGAIADGDSLTSLVLTAVGGNITTGNLFATGTAEALATVTMAATESGDISVGTITADSTDSVTDNDMVMTLSANGSGSSVLLNDVTNTFGTVTATISGDQAVSFTNGNGTITANTVTITREGSGDTTIDSIDATTTLNLTHSGTGTLTVSASDADTSATVSATSSGVLSYTSTTTDNATVNCGSSACLL